MSDPEPAPTSTRIESLVGFAAFAHLPIRRPNHGLTSGLVTKSPSALDRNAPTAKNPASGS